MTYLLLPAMSMGPAHTYLVTIFITLFRGFCFNKLPFEISSAPEHFQKRICSILKVLEVVLCRDHDVLVWPGSGGGKKMYHILKGLVVLFSSTGKVKEG